MSLDQTIQSTPTWRIADDMTVHGPDGEKLGTVRNYDPEAGYLDIQKGWLFHKDFYVGLAAITSVDEKGITLRLTKEDLKDDHFASPPMRGGFAYSGSSVTEQKPLEGEDGEVPVVTMGAGGFVE
jgi:hypothetical protein